MRRLLAALLLAFGIAPAWGAGVCTNLGIKFVGSGVTVVSIVVTQGGVPINSTIFVGAADGNTTLPTNVPTDSAGNVYQLIGQAFKNGSSGNGSGNTFYAANIAAVASGGAITYNKVTQAGGGAITVCYLTGVAASPLDFGVTAVATGSSTTPTVASLSASKSGEYYIGFVYAGSTLTQASGWVTPPASTSQSPLVLGGNRVNAGTGVLTYNPTTASANPWTAIIQAFKTATSVSQAITTPLLLLGIGG